jgi:protein SDA1
MPLSTSRAFRSVHISIHQSYTKFISATQLLEDHINKLRKDNNAGEGYDDDDEIAWKGWDVESDASEDSKSEGWMDVDSGNEDLEISDSDDEQAVVTMAQGKSTGDGDERSPNPDRVSTLATTKVGFL